MLRCKSNSFSRGPVAGLLCVVGEDYKLQTLLCTLHNTERVSTGWGADLNDYALFGRGEAGRIILESVKKDCDAITRIIAHNSHADAAAWRAVRVRALRAAFPSLCMRLI